MPEAVLKVNGALSDVYSCNLSLTLVVKIGSTFVGFVLATGTVEYARAVFGLVLLLGFMNHEDSRIIYCKF